jgi:hypothetical protein
MTILHPLRQRLKEGPNFSLTQIFSTKFQLLKMPGISAMIHEFVEIRMNNKYKIKQHFKGTVQQKVRGV